MADYLLDLDREIDELNQRWNELDALWPNPPGPTPEDMDDQQRQIQEWMQEISNKMLTLRTVRNNCAASRVTIRDLSDEEYDQVKTALANLSRVVQREQVFGNIIHTVTAVLEGASVV